jgi:murein DD-endopeptidase MepM/ murein hydrolase activator NlpD
MPRRTRPPRLRLVAGLATALALTVTPAWASDRDDLRQVRARLGQVRAVLGDARADAAQMTRALRAADAALVAADRSLHTAAARAVAARAASKRMAARITVVEAETAKLQGVMDARARHSYVTGVPAPLLGLSSMVEAASMTELVERRVVLNRIAGQDNTVLERLRDSRAELDGLKTELAASEREAEQAEADLRSQRGQLIALRRARQAAKKRLDAKVRALDAHADALAADSARISGIIRRREAAAEARARAIAARESASRRRADRSSRRTGERSRISGSGLRWPASCPKTSGFGYRWGRMHEGVDLGCPSGTAVHAARGGVVLSAGWAGGYGRLVLISHGDGLVTAYAHNSSLLVSAGQSVSRGDVISYSGSTGHSTGPHVHFEVRVGGVPRNPEAYLP